MSDATQSQGFTLSVQDSTGSPSNFLAIAGIKDFTGPGGKTTVIDASTLSSTAKEKLPGLPDEGQFQITCNFISGDVGQQELIAIRTSRVRRQFQGVIPAGSQNPSGDPAQNLLFFGYCTEASQKGGVDKLVEITFTIEIDGKVSRV